MQWIYRYYVCIMRQHCNVSLCLSLKLYINPLPVWVPSIILNEFKPVHFFQQIFFLWFPIKTNLGGNLTYFYYKVGIVEKRVSYVILKRIIWISILAEHYVILGKAKGFLFSIPLQNPKITPYMSNFLENIPQSELMTDVKKKKEFYEVRKLSQ